MKNLMNILRDTRIAIPLGFLLGLELFLQTGLYKSLKQPGLYGHRLIDSGMVLLGGCG
jgi:hypothetical protein